MGNEPTLPAELATVSGEIVDQQGFFNLNNLVKNAEPDQKAVKIFEQLLENLKLSPTWLAPWPTG